MLNSFSWITTHTCKLIILQQSHSRLTQYTNSTHFPCSECGNIKSRSMFSINSINYSLSQLFSWDLLYHKFSTSCHRTILAFKERKHSYVQRNCVDMHLNSEFNIARYSLGGRQWIFTTHLITFRLRCPRVYISLFMRSRRWKSSINAIKIVYSWKQVIKQFA